MGNVSRPTVSTVRPQEDEGECEMETLMTETDAQAAMAQAARVLFDAVIAFIIKHPEMLQAVVFQAVQLLLTWLASLLAEHNAAKAAAPA
jgi:hypothetical protein